jgi:hypothetical protein
MDEMKLSDAQWGALFQLAEHGPIVAKEIILPVAMDGSRRTKLQCHCLTKATMDRLEAEGLVVVKRAALSRPVNAVGKAGHRRNEVVVHITAKGTEALASI